MTVHISDSGIFANAWGTPELRRLFEDTALVRGWIEILAVLAEIQAEFGIIPEDAAPCISATLRTIRVDPALMEEARAGYERSNHSLLGLLEALQRRCPGNSGEWLCYGATVQDITDTQTARILLQVRRVFADASERIIVRLRELCLCYRDTPMCGRTHGQPGLPITFGFKVAGWLDEFMRHRARLEEVASRFPAGQLCGGVGSLSSFGANGIALQQRFCERLSLQVPAISWTASRDRLAEWLNLLMLISATGDRIGHEIYNLQRPEIGELSEDFMPGTVGSITMPQKRNPEISEHLGTLARSVRALAAQMGENLVHDHERDGRAWKAEWVIVPQACLCTGKTLVLLEQVLVGLRVNPARMQQNLEATQGFIHAEPVMLALATDLGRQSAHKKVCSIATGAQQQGFSFRDALLADPDIRRCLGVEAVDRILDQPAGSGCCAQMVDAVLRASERIGPGSTAETSNSGADLNHAQ